MERSDTTRCGSSLLKMKDVRASNRSPLAKVSSTALQAGDRVLLQCGDTWDEELQPKGNGTAANPIVISSFGKGPKPVIDRQDDKQDRVGIRLADQEGFKIVGLEFARCMTGIYAEYSDNCPTKKFIWIEDWLFENSEWGFVDIGLGSGDGEAFDFEGNCDRMTMRNCLFHDSDGPGFLLCCYASDGNPNKAIRMENCVLNGKSKRPIRLPRCEIVNTTDWTEATWTKCRFYLSPGENLMKVMDPEKDKKSKFVDCLVKHLSQACSTPNLAAKAQVSASSAVAGNEAAKATDGNAATCWKAAGPATDGSTAASGKPADPAGEWLQVEFATPQTINEFRIKEDPSSSVIRYVIQCWDAPAKKWTGCFNGRGIGPDFVAPIVPRTTRVVRLCVMRTTTGQPAISEFTVHNDPAGETFNDPTGAAAVGVVGK